MTTNNWNLDTVHSGINFTVRHMVVSKVRGRFAKFSGSVALDEGDLTRSVVDAELRRRSISAGPTPVSSTILSRPLWPETIATASRGTASAAASSRTTASFARPCSGASVTRTFHASPWRPTIADRPAPGLTRSRRRVVDTVMSEA